MLTRPLTQPLTGPLVRGVGEGGIISAFNPANLFAGGSKGIALDLTDKSKLYQDSARTTLVSAAGDPIGSVSDISGNGAHPTQATTASKPLWQTTYAALDGVDDYWATPTIDFSGTSKITVIVGVRKASDAASGTLLELGPGATLGTNPGSFMVRAPDGAATNYAVAVAGASSVPWRRYSPYAAGVSHVLSAVLDTAAASGPAAMAVRVNGVSDPGTSVDATTPTGSFGSYALYIGRRAGSTIPFGGRVYRVIVIGRALTATEIAQAERWCATAAGVAL